MKKVLPLLIVTAFIFFSCTKNDLSNTYWITVDSKPIPPETGNTIYDGMTIHFEDDNITFGTVFDKRNRSFDFRWEDEKIYVRDTLWGVLQKEYQDSLILDIVYNLSNARIKLVKLDKEHAIEAKPKIWEHKNWILSFSDYDRELFLTDSLFFYERHTKICVQKDLQKDRFFRIADKWRVTHFNGNQLFVKTDQQINKEFYRIKGYTGDSIIEIESLEFPDIPTRLVKKPYIPDSKKQKILSQIQDHTWKTSKIIKLDTVSRASRIEDTVLIKFKSLKDKKLSYKFASDGTYDIYESDIPSVHGKWKLSPTGSEIIIDSEIYPFNYIDLITVSPDSLVIGNYRRFETEDFNYGMDVEMYYKAILKR